MCPQRLALWRSDERAFVIAPQLPIMIWLHIAATRMGVSKPVSLLIRRPSELRYLYIIRRKTTAWIDVSVSLRVLGCFEPGVFGMLSLILPLLTSFPPKSLAAQSSSGLCPISQRLHLKAWPTSRLTLRPSLLICRANDGCYVTQPRTPAL